MQTFLTYSDFFKSARHLDNKRLNKQLLECWQIYDTIVNNKKAWSNHPAVNMWRGYELGLLYYGLTHYTEWQIKFMEGKRGGSFLHKSGELITEELQRRKENKNVILPDWIYDKRVLISHKSNLIRKNAEFYKPFWPNVPDNIPYFWPGGKK